MTLDGNKIYFGNWKDFFYHNVPEGTGISTRVPMYIPIRRAIDSHSMEVWLAPIAPLAFVWYLMGSISAIIYRDHVQWLDMILDNIHKGSKN